MGTSGRTMMAYLVFRSDQRALYEAGYGRVAHVPFLLRSDGTYPEHANRYLRSRAICDWPLRYGTDAEPSARKHEFLTPRTCNEIAYKLRMFLVWLESTNKDVISISYSDLLEWKVGLTSGAVSDSGKAITSSSAQLYVTEACLYLTWLSLIPLNSDGTRVRGAFHTIADSVQSTVLLPRAKASGSRARKNHRSKSVFHLPTAEAVAQWIGTFRSRFPVKSLAAELMLDSGIRISEANSMFANEFPTPAEWTIDDGRVRFVLTRGVKGPKVAADMDIAIRPREVSVNLKLAVKIDHYRSGTRETQIRRWIRAADTKSEQQRRQHNRPDQLWLSEHTNLPYATRQLHNAWTMDPSCPPGWHPHMARHWFAVERLVEYALLANKVANASAMQLTWLQGVMQNQVEFLLRPEMGHISVNTTQRYLRAARSRLEAIFGSSSLRWGDLIDSI